jgi:lantibiotic modifying enzyme
VLYTPSNHEPLTETPWDESRAREGIAEIVRDAEHGLRPDSLWRVHPREDPEEDWPEGSTTLYLGAAGVVWALDWLGTELDLRQAIERAVSLYAERPDFGERVPALWTGEAGIRAVALKVTGNEEHAERLLQLVRRNVTNETNELMWGAPGTMLAARAALEWTGDRRFVEVWEWSAEHLWNEWQADGLWTQHLYGREIHSLGPAHGFAGAVRALLQGDERVDEIRGRARPVVERTAIRENGLATWPPDAHKPLEQERGGIRVQWCHGAPGIVATLWDVAPEDLLVAGGELTWEAGPLVKGGGLCHGTAGNGYAFLKLHGLTGDERWLERARSFAMHALEQVEQARAEYRRGRYSLWTGDVGTAVYLRSCLDADDRVPTIDVW